MIYDIIVILAVYQKLIVNRTEKYEIATWSSSHNVYATNKTKQNIDQYWIDHLHTSDKENDVDMI